MRHLDLIPFPKTALDKAGAHFRGELPPNIFADWPEQFPSQQ
jgi:hypothetical protein